MCLAEIWDKRYPHKTGYKLLYKEKGKFHTGMCDADRVEINKDEYAKAKPVDIEISDTCELYNGGFHIFPTLYETRKVLKFLDSEEDDFNEFSNIVICKVAFEEQTNYGLVNWWSTKGGVYNRFPTRCVVAQKCKLLNEVRQ